MGESRQYEALYPMYMRSKHPKVDTKLELSNSGMIDRVDQIHPIGSHLSNKGGSSCMIILPHHRQALIGFA